MKLLYVAPLPIDFENLDGVPKKVLCQAGALQKEFDVDILSYDGKEAFLYHYADKIKVGLFPAKSKFSVLKAIPLIAKDNEYEAVYIRYPKSDYLFLKALRHLRQRTKRIVVEIPTFPYDKEGFETLRGVIINFFDRIFRKKIHKYVDRIITFSDDSEIFKIKTINTINGINFEETECDMQPISVNERIDLVAVSAMYRVHGYERLIEGIHNYYIHGGKRNIHLKLVGKGDECPKYLELVKEYGLNDHVTFYGAKFGEELSKIYEKNAVGINSLAIHRQNLEKESTLKTKEYAAKGLPMLSSSFVDALSNFGNDKYVMRIPADESSVNVEELVEFVDRIYGSEDICTIRQAIRADGEKTCDIGVTMLPVIYFLKSKD